VESASDLSQPLTRVIHSANTSGHAAKVHQSLEVLFNDDIDDGLFGDVEEQVKDNAEEAATMAAVASELEDEDAKPKAAAGAAEEVEEEEDDDDQEDEEEDNDEGADDDDEYLPEEEIGDDDDDDNLSVSSDVLMSGTGYHALASNQRETHLAWSTTANRVRTLAPAPKKKSASAKQAPTGAAKSAPSHSTKQDSTDKERGKPSKEKPLLPPDWSAWASLLDQSKQTLIDRNHHLTEEVAGIIFFAKQFDFDHLYRLLKWKLVPKIWDDDDRAAEAMDCVLRCIPCHIGKTWKNWEMVGHNKDVLFAPIQAQLLKMADERYALWKKQGGCCGVSWRPGQKPVCPHKKTWDALEAKIEKIFADGNLAELGPYFDHVDPAVLGPHGTLTASRFFIRLAAQWDHRLPADKRNNVSAIINELKRQMEIGKCDLVCVFCHRIKTCLMRENVSWSYSPSVLAPFTDDKKAATGSKRKQAQENDTSDTGSVE
jgi:hypothetical protein